jgi:hypothetical protein
MQSWEVALETGKDAARLRKERDELLLALKGLVRATEVSDNLRDMGVDTDAAVMVEARALIARIGGTR